jgi:hypothetical protein
VTRKIGVTVTLRPDQVEWLESNNSNMSEAVREAIDATAELDDE